MMLPNEWTDVFSRRGDRTNSEYVISRSEGFELFGSRLVFIRVIQTSRCGLRAPLVLAGARRAYRHDLYPLQSL